MGWFDFLLQPNGQPGGTMAQSAMMGADPQGMGFDPGMMRVGGGMTGGGPGMGGPAAGSDPGSVYTSLFNSPEYRQQALSNALMSMSGAMLKASGPSNIPMGMGGVLGAGIQGAQQGMEGQRERFTKDLLLGSQLETAKLSRDTQRGWQDFMRQFMPGGGGTAGAPPGGGAAPAGGTPGNYPDRIQATESPNGATNPQSGASGFYQFMPKTAHHLAQQTAWGRGLSVDQVMQVIREEATAGRKDKQQELLALYNRASDSALQQAGIPANDVTRFALHAFGPAGGISLLRAPDNMPVAEWVRSVNWDGASPEQVIAQNNLGKYQTVGQVKQDFIARRIGGGGSPAPSAAPQVAQAPGLTSAGSSIPQPGQVYIAPDGTARVRR